MTLMPLQCWLIANIFATNDIHLIVAPIIVTISTMAFIRIIHVMAGVAWFGAVVTVNTVLIPYLLSIEIGNRREVLTTLFPRIFRLASVLSLAAVLTGSALLCLYLTIFIPPSDLAMFLAVFVIYLYRYLTIFKPLS